MNHEKKQFLTILEKYSEKAQYEKVLRKAYQKYDLQPYKANKLTCANAKKLFSGLLDKYEAKQLEYNDTTWHENQRRLFIWFLLYFADNIQVTLQNLKLQHFKTLSKIFFNKDPVFLQFQCKTILKPKGRPGWTTEQDNLLIKAVEQKGQGKWNQISKQVYFTTNRQIFKSHKQCRERWYNHLDPTKLKSDWTPQQDLKLLLNIKQNGKKWAKVSTALGHTRTDHMIKNRYNSLIGKNSDEGQLSEKQIIESLISKLKKDTKQGKNYKVAKQSLSQVSKVQVIIPQPAVKEENQSVSFAKPAYYQDMNKEENWQHKFPINFIMEARSPIGISPFPFKIAQTPQSDFFKNYDHNISFFDQMNANRFFDIQDDKSVKNSQGFNEQARCSMEMQINNLNKEPSGIGRTSSFSSLKPEHQQNQRLKKRNSLNFNEMEHSFEK